MVEEAPGDWADNRRIFRPIKVVQLNSGFHCGYNLCLWNDFGYLNESYH